MTRASTKSKSGTLLMAGVATLAMGLTSCEEGEVDENCRDNEQFFREAVYAPVLETTCMTCHTSQGEAKDSQFILVDSAWGPDYIQRNMEVVETLAKLQFEGRPWILLKPTLEIEELTEGKETHGGGLRLPKDSEEYKSLEEMIARFSDPVTCEEQEETDFFEGVELLDEVATLRKASLSLVGRLPSADEEQRVRDGGFDALDVVLDEMMAEEAFFLRLKEIYNDHFLTDRYYGGTGAVELLNQARYPNAFWFESITDDNERELAEYYSNTAVAREAVELVAHVVRNQRPFTEILTAGYMVVNPWSAKVYGVNPQFEDSYDTSEFVEVQLQGIPHAGVLTSNVMMNRLPTTPTNRNRHRARKVYEFFLGTDVLKLGARPIDPNAQQDFNPTMFNSQCAICHAVIDPVAGTFANWDEFGDYNPPDGGWFPDMRQPGFNEAIMPAEQDFARVQWLGHQVVNDNRFPIAVIHTMFKGLSGQDPLREPTDPNTDDYLPGIRAYEVQQDIFRPIADQFVESNFDLRTVVKEIVKTPYYRAHNAVGLSPERELELKQLGTGRLLTPEQLHRKIEAVTGYPWRADFDSDEYLISMNWYRIFYGGIDSDSVVKRITEPNGIMANVAARMGNEVSCWTTGRDFALDASERRLFPFVEPGFEPEDNNGFEVPESADAIRANIQYLHQRMLGEFLDLGDPEINRTYELFVNVWKDGRQGLESGDYQTQLPGDCQVNEDYWTHDPLPEDLQVTNDPDYTIRAWMAVMSYLLSDYRFLHE